MIPDPICCDGNSWPKLPVHITERKSGNMQVNVSARHGNLQPGDQPLVVEKVEKLRRLYDRINAIEVTIDLKQLDKPSVEIKVSAEHAEDCVATAESTTVIAALDAVIPKVEQQLRRLKEKKTGHRATGIKHIDPVVADED
ncbi:ribosome hibernation-promoting factor, HPF/YfiA family [Rubripirellula reticaptiva]|nr:ribosome-associated translation inhibitor RaiA [Rubripirellula reticaptiva]